MMAKAKKEEATSGNFQHEYVCTSKKCADYLKSKFGSTPSQRIVTTDSETPPDNVQCRVLIDGESCHSEMKHIATRVL